MLGLNVRIECQNGALELMVGIYVRIDVGIVHWNCVSELNFGSEFLPLCRKCLGTSRSKRIRSNLLPLGNYEQTQTGLLCFLVGQMSFSVPLKVLF